MVKRAQGPYSTVVKPSELLEQNSAKGTAGSECDVQIKDEYDCGNSDKSRSQSPPGLHLYFFKSILTCNKYNPLFKDIVERNPLGSHKGLFLLDSLRSSVSVSYPTRSSIFPFEF